MLIHKFTWWHQPITLQNRLCKGYMYHLSWFLYTMHQHVHGYHYAVSPREKEITGTLRYTDIFFLHMHSTCTPNIRVKYFTLQLNYKIMPELQGLYTVTLMPNNMFTSKDTNVCTFYYQACVLQIQIYITSGMGCTS